jgi:chromosome segregation ATPase
MKKNTYTLAYEACETYFSQSGQLPTIETIKPIINVNSPTTISNAIKDWKQSLSKTLNKTQDPDIPKTLTDAINAIWEQALIDARSALYEQTNELQHKQTDLEQKEKALSVETSRIEQWVKLTEQKYKEEIGFLKKDISRLSTETVNLNEQTEHYRLIASEFEKDNAVLNEQIRQEKDKYYRLEKQYDKEHDWAIKRIEEEKNNYKQQLNNEMERLKSETFRSKQTTDILQSKLDLIGKEVTVNRDKITELERSLAEEKLKQAELMLIQVKLQKELNDKNEQIRLRLKKATKT